MEAKNARVMEYSRWLQYVNYFFPEITLRRPKEDACDGCYAINIELSNPDLTAERKEEQLIKNHIAAAIIPRRAMQAFNKIFIRNKDPSAIIPDVLLPDLLEEDEEDVDPEADGTGDETIVNVNKFTQTLTVQGEDCGGTQGLPHYGYTRPSLDYYNSNLLLYNFVVSDVVTKINNIFYFDERGQGKGLDAFCTLRLRYHLRKWHLEIPPLYSLSILDNCVGQNKSQRMMKFYALMSILFYDEVAADSDFWAFSHASRSSDCTCKTGLEAEKCLASQRIGEVS